MNMNQNQNPYQGQSYTPNNTYGQMPGQGMGQTPGWNQPPGYGQSNPGSPRDTRGGGELAVASLVLGILSIVLCCLYGWASGVLGIAGLVVGIISCARHNAGRGMAIAGIITSVLGIVLSVIAAFFEQRIIEDGMDYFLGYFDKEILERNFVEYGDGTDGVADSDIDPFAGHEFAMGDDTSVMVFGEDQSVLCYLVDDTDSYLQGTYTAYRGETAVEMLFASEYDMTDDIVDYFSQDPDGIYTSENFTILIFRMELGMIDGEYCELPPELIDDETYIGFFAEEYGYYYAVCMDHGEHVMFVMID